MADTLPPIPERLPVVATTNLVLFPFMLAPLTVGREHSLAALDAALQGDRIVAMTMQRDPDVEKPTPEEMHVIGCACLIARLMRTPDGNAQVIVQGLSRVRLSDFLEENGVLTAKVEVLTDEDEKSMANQALMNNLLGVFRRIVELSPVLPDEAFGAAQAQDSPGKLADFVASTLNIAANERQQLLDELDVQKRLETVTQFANSEVNVLELSGQIQDATKKELDKGQRDFILRQQLREIQKQLGDDEDSGQDIEELRKQIEEAGMPEEIRAVADKEMKRLGRTPPSSPEYSVARNYLDYLIAIPWSKSTEDNLDIANAKRTLDEEHYGLDDVKDRVLEYLAIRKLNPNGKGPILCFVGPPGVGKTSLAHSIANALGRKFVRMALGGVRDEAEIRGHRRTYIGAMPGRIAQGLRDAGTNNPVMILDEIDKLGADYRGDPTSALLEVLDPQQNNTFKDHYLEVPLDLSKVMFITTANVLDTIPGPLRDRMEVLRIAGYTMEEKAAIARRYLLPRQMTESGLTDKEIHISDEALRAVVSKYTREAGVRNLEREVGTICRKVARQIAESSSALQPLPGSGEVGPDGVEAPIRSTVSSAVEVTPENLEAFLGASRYEAEMGNREAQVGVSTGMAWTPVGGEVLFIETAKIPGKGGLTVTGQLGDVMKESVSIALDYLRSHADTLNLPADFADNWGIHVHVPAGAIPKDGPSAGVAMTTALASLMTNRPARHDIAMTGEVTLTGRVLPIGGVKEKVLAARQAGIKRILLPERNRADVKDIPEEARAELQIDFVSDVRDAIEIVLLPAAAPESESAALDISTPLEQASDAS